MKQVCQRCSAFLEKTNDLQYAANFKLMAFVKKTLEPRAIRPRQYSGDTHFNVFPLLVEDIASDEMESIRSKMEMVKELKDQLKALSQPYAFYYYDSVPVPRIPMQRLKNCLHEIEFILSSIAPEKLAVYYESEGSFKEAAKALAAAAKKHEECDPLHASLLYEKAAMDYAICGEVDSSKEALFSAERLNPTESAKIKTSLASILLNKIDISRAFLYHPDNDYQINPYEKIFLKFAAELLEKSDPVEAWRLFIIACSYDEAARLMGSDDPLAEARIREQGTLHTPAKPL